MLTIYGGKQRFCDGVSRRSFLKIGAFSFGTLANLSLADLLRAEAATGKKLQHKSVIHIFLAGGPPLQDMWDMKPNAPAEIRGEFKPVSTNLDGLQICEVMPRLAKMMDRFAVLRSLVGAAGDHDAYQCMTGWRRNELQGVGGYPSVGSVVAKVQGPVDPTIPAAVGLAAPTRERRWSDSGSPGFLGPAYAPFKPFMTGATPSPQTQKQVGAYENGPGLDVIKLKGVTLDRLQDRRRMLEAIDSFRRDLEHSEEVQALDASLQNAFDILASSKLADALDLSKENPKLVERYGDGKPYQFQYDGAPTCNEHLLMARRLVEAGCRSVTLSYGRWDSHSRNGDLVRDHAAKLDQCLTALMEDLEQRGMLEDVTVLVWGEFSRTPQINKDGGRDHWPAVNGALMAGGGLKVGQVIGATDEHHGAVIENPIHMRDVIATVYHNLGIDPGIILPDKTGRPQFVLDNRHPIRELVG